MRWGKKAIHVVESRSRAGQPLSNWLEFGLNEWVVDEQYERYLRDPGSVDRAWRDLFAVPGRAAGTPVREEPDAAGGRAEEAAVKAVRVAALVHVYRVRGHLMADTDPLTDVRGATPWELDLKAFGLGDEDLDRTFVVDGFAGRLTMTLRDVLEVLRASYCRTVGVQYMHIQSSEERRWVQQRIEAPREAPDRAEQLQVLYRLGAAEAFERFLHTKYVGQKRYSLEGGESAIVLLDALLHRAIAHGMKEAVIGMAHRGRLNVLANIIGKSYREIFYEFEDAVDLRSVQGSGDVKYHLGADGTYRALSGGSVGVRVVANPSHLEVVGPVAQGVVRARQEAVPGGDGVFAVLPVAVHGDAAFAGQGVVGETLNMSQVAGYHTGGTVHVVINNQLGFTTTPAHGRSSAYATDVARAVEAPVLHVNGDDPEAVVRAARLAFDYRQEFRKDVVVDLICYRRHGHSEVDDPSITQPEMYDRIDARPSVRTLYADALVRRGDIGARQAEDALRDYRERLERAFAETRPSPVPGRPARDVVAKGTEHAAAGPVTAITEATARRVVAAQTELPPGFTVHPRVLPQLRRRAGMLDAGTIDWATAEALAFGSLLLEGVPVRLAGQDSRRGTFGQRHAVLTDRRTGAEHTPLGSLGAGGAAFTPYDSTLSELAVLGFEYGYSLARPEALVLWEAQFGDFADGAQTVVDEYVASSEQKWGQRSGVVLLLPHGLEGQGPDHSSGRIERFLQLCAQGNMTVAVPTLPGNYFHLLRRQALGSPDRRRPLVVFTPKSMLRSKAAVSALPELTTGGFRPVLPDGTADPARAGRVLICCGKVFYDLDAHRRAAGGRDTAIVRLEQLYPFPERELAAELARFPAGAEVRWVQEEAENQGAWLSVSDSVRRLAGRPVGCVSRPAASAAAVGSARRHAEEQGELVAAAFR
ncbi:MULTISPECIES: multifunctional oxoglutarate decarboxylase/oxoglutarate dehydrogenase thiamine pyrophosphate-binding subunit/dihydrolipoyllysine-residue succinyltransferase subunit [unclassified Streptomyces]|uniref:multifunctional oxoglutarate decarboxylase/oxoglutarate dehydrogenase thiamine pyrophosphate-binding subunit/dihydrolipoyllysine-residue succinyltransferase subunit n=1 Tax=unclassified Streptomyces TaxID=2593676 RepID=UPI00331B700F